MHLSTALVLLLCLGQAKEAVDAYGDPLPAGAIARLGTTRLRHPGNVRSVAVTADGKFLASADQSSAVCLWDARTGQELRRCENVLGAHSLEFTPDGTLLVGGDHDGIIRVWDVASGRELRQLPGPKTIAFFTQALAIAPDGLTVAAGNGKVVSLWDLRSGKEMRRFLGHDSEIHSVSFSADGKFLASAGSRDGTVRVWNVADGQEVKKFAGGYPIALSRDGKMLALGEPPHKLVLRDVGTGAVVRQVSNMVRSYAGLRFTKDGSLLAWVDWKENKIHLHDVATGQERLPLPGRHGNAVYGLAFSGDGKLLASGHHDRLVRLWDTQAGKETLSWPGHRWSVQSVAFSPDRKTILTSSGDSVWLWDAATLNPLPKGARGQKGETRPGAWPAAFSPDGKILVTCSDNNEEYAIRLWEAASGKLLGRCVGHQNLVRGVAFACDGSRLASGGFDLTVRLWDPASGKLLKELQGHQGGIYSVAFHPKSPALLATGGYDHTIRLWDTNKGQAVGVLTGHDRGVNALAFAPDGSVLASGAADKSIRFWDISSKKQLGEPWREHTSMITSLAFSADGRILVSTGYDGVVLVWERLSGQVVKRFEVPEFSVSAAAVSCDGRLLLTGNSDSTALVWDLTGRMRSGRLPTVRASEDVLTGLWNDLASQDAGTAWDATWAMIQSPGQSELFLREKLRPAVAPDAKKVRQWLADLGGDDFQLRQRAMQQLEALADAVEPDLRTALAKDPPLEATRRLQQLLDRATDVAKSPRRLQELRALHVLEQLGTPQAREVLQQLAKGATAARVTRDANDSLKRLAN